MAPISKSGLMPTFLAYWSSQRQEQVGVLGTQAGATGKSGGRLTPTLLEKRGKGLGRGEHDCYCRLEKARGMCLRRSILPGKISRMPITPRFDLRPGVTDPVVLMISRRQVERGDIASVLKELKPLLATREDVWLYRGQMTLVLPPAHS